MIRDALATSGHDSYRQLVTVIEVRIDHTGVHNGGTFLAGIHTCRQADEGTEPEEQPSDGSSRPSFACLPFLRSVQVRLTIANNLVEAR
jgi:hypothetical protein